MAHEPGNRDQAGFTKIKPASIDLSPGAAADRATRGRSAARPLLLAVALAIALAAVGGVVFVLPDWVPTPTPQAPAPGEARSSPPMQTAAAVQPPSAAPAAPAETPWQRAQQSELRKQTQKVLAEMLDAQKSLEEHGVKVWADSEYRQAIAAAEAGDKAYASRDFSQALADYRKAHEILTGLAERIEPVFEEMMAKGNQALDAGDSQAAAAAFDVALAIDALDRAAKTGRERADKLDEVLAHLQRGDELLEDDDLKAALASYQEALSLDGESRAAKEKIESVRQRITARRFKRAMSAGFAHLQANELEQARQSFTEAVNIDPGSPEARSALEQSKNLIKGERIKSLLAEAQSLEDREDWQGAVEKYDAVLALEANLAVAQSGKQRAGVRAQIHDELEQLLANPERLFDRNVYQDAADFHEKLSGISNPGPVLSSQLNALDALLEKADTPVPIQLKSDNLTTVTVYKVGDLGQFDTMDLTLRPGRYVAVGSREGYRDVRVEFFVGPGKSVQSVNIRATEKIDASTPKAAQTERI